MVDKKLIDLLWYMVGEQYKTNHGLCWDFQRSAPVPVVASPISQYLNEVNRFLFSGGLQVDLTFALDKDPRQDYINKIIKINKFQSILESVWVTGAITGELLVHIRPQDNIYKFDWYDCTEFEYNKDLGCICIETLRIIKNKEYIFKLDLYPNKLVEYQLVESRYVTINFNWSKFATEVPHNYGFIPAMVVKNCNSINSSRGTGEFNFAAARVNAAIMMATFDGLENTHFFGSPVLASPDPDDTLERIKKRVQVYQKEANEDGGSIDVLDFKPIKGEHLKLIEKLESNFNNLMGIKVNSEIKSSDMSSLALRILNASTISKAETKWETYVQDGFKPLFERVLLMAKMDGILSQISLDNLESYDLTITRKKPYFDSSPLEKLQQLQVATAMVDLGVDRTVALKETIWSQYSIQQIEEKLRLNLEDV